MLTCHDSLTRNEFWLKDWLFIILQNEGNVSMILMKAVESVLTTKSSCEQAAILLTDGKKVNHICIQFRTKISINAVVNELSTVLIC